MKTNQLAKLYSCISVLFLVCMSSNAQDIANVKDNRSYSVFTYVIIGSNQSIGQTGISNELSESLKDIKNEFGFRNFQVALTHFQNVKPNGKVDYSSIIEGRNSYFGTEKPIFTNFTLQNFYNTDQLKHNNHGFQSFSFRARFPYISEVPTSEGKQAEIINYENIYTSSKDVEIVLNKPTLISSLPVGEKAFFFVVKIEKN